MEDKNVLDFETIAFTEEGVGYAAAFETNGLYKVDLESQKCNYIMRFPNEDVGGNRIYGSALYYDSEIYFIPMSGKYISIFNIDQNAIDQVSIPVPLNEFPFYKDNFKFSEAVYYKEYIYIFPFTYPGILKLDVATNKITVLNNWVPREGYFFRGGMCRDESHVYLPSGINKIILEFNMETEQTVIHQIGMHNNGAMCIHKYEDCYWIVPRLKGSIIIWNPERNIVNEITEYPRDFKSGKIVFSKIICCGKKLFFMPASANSALSINKNTGEIMIEDKWKPNENALVTCMFETDSYYYFCEYNNSHEVSKRYRICKADGKTEPYAFIVENTEEFKRDYIGAAIEQREIMKESENFKLGDFLNLI